MLYDVATDRWTARAHLPERISGPSLASLGKNLYLAGGTTVGTHPLLYSAALNRWTTVSEIDIPRSTRTVAAGNTLYAVQRGENRRPIATALIQTFYLFEPIRGEGETIL